MPYSNTPATYGSVTRFFHWLTALLILTAIPLGVIANDMAYDSSEALATKAQLFSYHKTLGVAAFLVGVLRILWALGQRAHPAPLHPDRRAETMAAAVAHWLLYVSLVAVPLSGWVHHAATTGFAPILWPFGQSLPFVPQSEIWAATAAAMHWVFTKLLVVTILAHILGALKHSLFDKDATLARMLRGTAAGPAMTARTPGTRLPAIAALGIYAAGTVLALALTPAPQTATETAVQTTAPASETQGNWQVEAGTLSLSVTQLGNAVSGQFDRFDAEIRFDETPVDGINGAVTVRIDTTSLTLGSVTAQAQGADFLDTATHATALFEAQILPDGEAYLAQGTLSLRGITLPVALPFTLTIDGDRAQMTGETRLDRRDFGIGAAYPDAATVGTEVTIRVTLTATRRAN